MQTVSSIQLVLHIQMQTLMFLQIEWNWWQALKTSSFQLFLQSRKHMELSVNSYNSIKFIMQNIDNDNHWKLTDPFMALSALISKIFCLFNCFWSTLTHHLHLQLIPHHLETHYVLILPSTSALNDVWRYASFRELLKRSDPIEGQLKDDFQLYFNRKMHYHQQFYTGNVWW